MRNIARKRVRRFARGAAALALLLGVRMQPALADDRDGFLYVTTLYDQRYSDTIFSADASKPFGSAKSPFRPYVDLLVNLDSQSLSEQIPSILTDDYALGAIGGQYVNDKGLRAFFQIGVTARIGAVAAHEPGSDVRSGVELYRNWGGLTENRSAYGNFYGNGTYISRDKDAVLFDQIESGRSFHAGRTAAVDVYAHAIVTLDTSRFYYSNTAEGALGLRLRAVRATGLSLTVEKSLGVYIRQVARPAGVYSSYRNFHANLSYALPF